MVAQPDLSDAGHPFALGHRLRLLAPRPQAMKSALLMQRGKVKGELRGTGANGQDDSPNGAFSSGIAAWQQQDSSVAAAASRACRTQYGNGREMAGIFGERVLRIVQGETYRLPLAVCIHPLLQRLHHIPRHRRRLGWIRVSGMCVR